MFLHLLGNRCIYIVNFSIVKVSKCQINGTFTVNRMYEVITDNNIIDSIMLFLWADGRDAVSRDKETVDGKVKANGEKWSELKAK